jgi:DNA-binding FrmR family transcriptional regulator
MKQRPHASHPDIVRRLKRALGQLNAVVTMIEQEKPCGQVAQQFQAVEKAISHAKKTFIHDHIDHCLEHGASKSARRSGDVLKEFKDISKYL